MRHAYASLADAEIWAPGDFGLQAGIDSSDLKDAPSASWKKCRNWGEVIPVSGEVCRNYARKDDARYHGYCEPCLGEVQHASYVRGLQRNNERAKAARKERA